MLILTRNRGFIFVAILLMVLLTACIQTEEPDVVPEIVFVEASAVYCTDALGNENKCVELSFDLFDGDGNVGLSESDTLPPFVDEFRHNFYFDVFEFQNGHFIPWPQQAVNYFNIPYLVPQGQNKSLIARVTIDIQFSPSQLPSDTIYIRFFVYDRTFNQSNTDSTHVLDFPYE
ncbi:MAG: hypothetical protein PF489_15530 [Salinivirgaceae bacterium]|jgi:hypothetical protein|nr:hypothetical protein [Salinivirgaceae bacterium]